MKIIAQFIWTLSDALGVIGLLIMVLAFGVAWMWAAFSREAGERSNCADRRLTTTDS